MNLQIKITEVHERRHRVALNPAQLEALLIEVVRDRVGVTGPTSAIATLSETGAVISLTEQIQGSALPQAAAPADPVPVVPNPAPAKAATPKPNRAPAVMSKATAWTADEDELIISRRAGDLRDLSINAASHALAEVLPNRTQGAIYLRIKSKLTERIDAAMDAVDLAALDASTATERNAEAPLEVSATAATREAQHPPERAQDANSEPAARLPLWQIEIGQRLDALGYANGWSAVEDLELVDLICTGWKLGDAATRLHRDITATRERWQLLVVATVGQFRSMKPEEQQRLATTLKARKG